MKQVSAVVLCLVAGLAMAEPTPPNECGNHGNNCTINNGGGGGGNAQANAQAVGIGVGVGISKVKVESTNVNANNNLNVNSNKQGQFQGQSQRQTQEQGQSQTAAAHNEGVTSQSNVGVSVVNESKRQAPGFGVASPYPTASCRGGVGASFSGPGFGFGLSDTPADEDCQRLEAARFALHYFQDKESAKELWCKTSHAKELKACAAYKKQAHSGEQMTTMIYGGNEGFTVQD